MFIKNRGGGESLHVRAAITTPSRLLLLLYVELLLLQSSELKLITMINDSDSVSVIMQIKLKN